MKWKLISVLFFSSPGKARSRGARQSIINPEWNFERMGIGGLDKEFSDIFRRAFASRVFPPDIVEQMGESARCEVVFLVAFFLVFRNRPSDFLTDVPKLWRLAAFCSVHCFSNVPAARLWRGRSLSDSDVSSCVYGVL